MRVRRIKKESMFIVLFIIMMMAQMCREFDNLLIIKYTYILSNILYSGVWCRFEVIHKKRKEAGEKDND